MTSFCLEGGKDLEALKSRNWICGKLLSAKEQNWLPSAQILESSSSASGIWLIGGFGEVFHGKRLTYLLRKEFVIYSG